MKKIIIAAIAAMTIASGANADTTDDKCKIHGDFAREIMQARQDDVPLDTMLVTLREKDFILSKTITIPMLITAYETKIYLFDTPRDMITDSFVEQSTQVCELMYE